MSRTLALIGNRPKVCAAAAQKYVPSLNLQRESEGAVARGWGVGFYQAGEPLLRRRPVDERELVEISSFQDVSSSSFLAHLRTPSIGTLRTENTPPFRYRKWLFSMRGTIGAFDAIRPLLLEEQSALLRAGIRGQSDGECLFFSFLDQLDKAVGLNREVFFPGDIGLALADCMSQLDLLLRKEGLGPAEVDCFVMNGEHLVALNRSGAMSYRWLEDTTELSPWLSAELGETGAGDCRCAIVASGLADAPENWVPVPSDSLVLCSRTEAPVLKGL